MSHIRIMASLLLMLSVIQSCKEIGPQIIKGQVALMDTTYMTSVPPKQARVVVIEEYTGAKCTNCPAGHVTVKSLVNAHPGQIAAIAYHKFGTALDEPVYLGEPDFDALKDDYRRDEATNIMNAIYGPVTNIPQAGIDRVFDGANRVYVRPQWAGIANSRLTQPTALNLEANLEWKADSSYAILNLKGIYTAAVSEPQVLNIFLLENNLISPQKYPDSTSKYYHHEHVFRKAFTPPTGRPILAQINDIQPGRAFEIALDLGFSPLWNLANCEIVAFVSSNGQNNKQVQQAVKIKVIP